MDNKGPPPPYGMHHPQPPPPQVVYTVHQTRVMNFGPDSAHATCPSCNANIKTRVDTECTTKTHLFALLLCLIFCPCGLIPYCTDSCKAVNHYCPSCGAYLGSYDH